MVALPQKFIDSLSFGSEETDTFKAKRIPLGDGYALRVVEGINPLEEELQLNWIEIKKDDAKELRQFWRDTEGTESVQFTPPDGDEEISVIAKGKLSYKYVAYNTRTVSVAVERVYDNG